MTNKTLRSKPLLPASAGGGAGTKRGSKEITKEFNENEKRSLAVLAITVARDSGEQGPGENVRVGCRAVLTCEGQVADRREMEKDYHQDYHPKTSRDEKR